MLAREQKIKNIKRQREFIKRQLSSQRDDGNTAYRYIGQVLPEVIDYFRNEGYKVERISTYELLAETHGLPVYLFTISDEVGLSKEELKAAEQFDEDPEEDPDEDEDIPDLFSGMISSIIGQ